MEGSRGISPIPRQGGPLPACAGIFWCWAVLPRVRGGSGLRLLCPGSPGLPRPGGAAALCSVATCGPRRVGHCQNRVCAARSPPRPGLGVNDEYRVECPLGRDTRHRCDARSSWSCRISPPVSGSRNCHDGPVFRCLTALLVMVCFSTWLSCAGFLCPCAGLCPCRGDVSPMVDGWPPLRRGGCAREPPYSLVDGLSPAGAGRPSFVRFRRAFWPGDPRPCGAVAPESHLTDSSMG